MLLSHGSGSDEGPDDGFDEAVGHNDGASNVGLDVAAWYDEGASIDENATQTSHDHGSVDWEGVTDGMKLDEEFRTGAAGYRHETGGSSHEPGSQGSLSPWSRAARLQDALEERLVRLLTHSLAR